MFLDASAIVAILGNEADAVGLEKRIDAATTPFFTSPIAIFEAVAAIARQRAPSGLRRVTPELLEGARLGVAAFLEALGVGQVLVGPEIGRKAIAVAGQFGNIVGHKADLNFGDCFAYACAKACRVPLLYKGNDFSQTDLA